MATDRERMAEDAQANGFDRHIFADTSKGDHAQRAYMAVKLFQIERHLRRLSAAAELSLVDDDESSGCG
jgi:hypothetical protein